MKTISKRINSKNECECGGRFLEFNRVQHSNTLKHRVFFAALDILPPQPKRGFEPAFVWTHPPIILVHP